MKARIKATGEIVDVVSNGLYYESIKDARIFDKSELEIMSKTKDPDYWTRLKHQYIGMFMKSFLDNFDGTATIDELADIAIDITHTLVEKIKEERK
jgi:hypothetical protein